MSKEECGILIKIPNAGEIDQTLKAMNPYKAPGLDRYPSIFYIECWEIIVNSVIDVVQDFFKSGFMLKELNHTFIVLILKTLKPYEFADYRPISLCNLIYKLISKILANRMTSILKRIIAPTKLLLYLVDMTMVY